MRRNTNDGGKLARLKAALREGEADLAAGRATVSASGEDIAQFFRRLDGAPKRQEAKP